MMKELLAATTTTLVMQTATAQVPASITLYGLMDAGINYKAERCLQDPQPDVPCESARAAWAP